MGGATAPHLAWFGLTRDPFPVVPDTEHFFLPRRLEALLAELLHAIHTRKGFLTLTGEVGLGKSTLSRLVLERLEHQPVETALLLNTYVQGPALLREVVRDFGLEPDDDTTTNLERLNHFLLEQYNAGRNCVIVVDDAQNLTHESLELIRLISNLETGQAKLVQILLVGQPELMETLAKPELRQLRSRIVYHARVGPLSQAELEQYIAFKLNTAGQSGAVQLTRSAARIIHRATGGAPRRVNIFMDRCLHGLYADGEHRITPKLAREVARDLAAQEPDPQWRPGRPLWAGWPGGRWSAGAVGALVLTLVVAGIWLPRSEDGYAAALFNPSAGQASDDAAEVAEAEAAAESEPDEDPLEAFLTELDLADQTGRVRMALEGRRLEPVADRIAEETAIHLFRVPERPVGTPALDLTQLDRAPSGYLVAWEAPQPVDELTDNPDAVRLLQIQLAHLGHYNRAVDGIAGPGTREAINRFRREHDLPEREELDARTRFLIQQHSGLDTARP